ncbi:hypothetical protein FNH13_14795 [Ornithinimicrobium ciconiae]|uniref:Uncharacterized protein n=1 Tax=Ornithinimicrobium ciconiae TaxID=2594265 RepID=A0A516GD49_9MICO|nr:hypothetical protein [Ornithinimicrobium ciconiae]QDO89441.1 hypothetical protein FNH13_14795 [Ornithinimicrobium ciconiae]
MIPTMLLFGLVFGRWWKTCLAVGTVGWPLLLWLDNIVESPIEIFGAAGLAALNTVVGVAIHQSLLHLFRWLRKNRRTPDQAAA